jgi:predicted nucleotidyltransferase
MRLSETEKKTLVRAVLAQDSEAKVWLFGSRVDDEKRGGDLDIAVLSSRIGRSEKMHIRRSVADALGEQKIDVVVSTDGEDAFFRLALEHAVRLDE